MEDTEKNDLNEQRRKRLRVHRMKNGIMTFMGLWILIVTVALVLLGWRVIVLESEVRALLKGSETSVEAEAEAPADDSDAIGVLVQSESGTGEENLRNADDILKVYLTFDDGPSDNSNEILDILDDYGVKATFFVCGNDDPEYVDIYRRIVDEGHTIAMHSYSHQYKEIYSSLEAFTKDYEKIHDLIFDLTGVDAKFYRFPGGSSNQVSNMDMSNFIQYLNDQNAVYVDWNVSCGDATTQGYTADDLVENVMNDVVKYKTSVVLLHDAGDKDATVEALPRMIESLQAEGAIILPISDDTRLIQHVTLVQTEN